MTIDELIEELTRLRDIYGGFTKVKVPDVKDGQAYNMTEIDRAKISPDANLCVELLP